jgi:hypothetical protein
MSESGRQLANENVIQPPIGISGASFWCPDFLEHSAWIEHAPFAFWIVGALKPRSLVELGTHRGYSYFAFCQAVQRLGLNTRCHAVDTWKGDEHAGFYGEEVFEEVRNYNDKHYLAFSSLVRSTFDEALSHISDTSVDLLHIDGRHFYEDVKHDFESWCPKLSERAVVLFHDTNERLRNFGVFRLWEELICRYPSFEFLHGHGLGVLGYGASLPQEIKSFFDATSDASVTGEVRAAYARLGSALKAEFDSGQIRRLNKSLEAERENARAEIKRLAQEAQATADAAWADRQRLETQLEERLRLTMSSEIERDSVRAKIERLARQATRLGRAVAALCNARRRRRAR